MCRRLPAVEVARCSLYKWVLLVSSISRSLPLVLSFSPYTTMTGPTIEPSLKGWTYWVWLTRLDLNLFPNPSHFSLPTGIPTNNIEYPVLQEQQDHYDSAAADTARTSSKFYFFLFQVYVYQRRKKEKKKKFSFSLLFFLSSCCPS